MIILQTLIDLPQASLIGWWILHSSWQGLLVGAVFAAARFGLRHQAARTRYAAGCIALLLIAVAPLCTMLVTAPSVERLSSIPPALTAPLSLQGEREIAAGAAVFSQTASALLAQDLLARIAPYLAPVWLVGVVICSVRLARSCRQVRMLRTQGTQPVEPHWVSRLNQLRARIGVTQPVRLLRSALVEVPTVIGWLRPVILFPAATLTGLTPAQVEAILAHELAHVRRFDHFVNAAQCLLEAVMFFHPVVWWVSRCVREEREHCCDDLVLETCESPLAYAQALATLEMFRAMPPQVAFAANGGSLLNRLRRLAGSNPQEPATTTHVTGLALLGIGVVLILAGFLQVFRPAEFEAVARLKVEPDGPAVLETIDDPTRINVTDPYSLQTEFAILQSQSVLYEVVRDLNLQVRWGDPARRDTLDHDEAVMRLRRKVQLRPIRNSRLVEIRVTSETPEEAAQIANGIARAYCDLRAEARAETAQRSLAVVRQELEEQESQVRKKQTEVDHLAQELQILDSPFDGAVQFVSNSSDAMRKLESLRVETKAQLVGEATLLKSLKSLPAEQASAVISTASPDPLLSSLLERLNVAEQKLIEAKKEFSPQHAEFIKAQSVIEDLLKKVDRRVEGILLGLEHRVTSLQGRLSELETQLKNYVHQSQEKLKQTRPYYQARRELDEMEASRQLLSRRLASEKLQASLRSGTTAQVVAEAMRPQHAGSGNRSLGAALIVCGLFLDAAGLAMLRMKKPAKAV